MILKDDILLSFNLFFILFDTFSIPKYQNIICIYLYIYLVLKHIIFLKKKCYTLKSNVTNNFLLNSF